jgi:hypothetical protein
VSIPLAVLMQISVSVQVPDTIAARTAVPVVVRATVPGNTAPRISVPTINGAALQLVTDVTRLGGGFGQAVATRETRYVLRVSEPGSVTLSSVVATLGWQEAISPAKTIVVQPPPTNAVPAIVSRAPLSRSSVVNFHSLVTPDSVWAGEQVTLQVGVFIDDDLRSQLQRNPEYVAPSVDGAVAYDLPVANDGLPSRMEGGARYRPFIFARALFPLRAGTLIIPPARLGYTLGAAGTLFGRQERQFATTPTRSVIVRELPADGRPTSFAGAVGVYTMTASVERTNGRVGDAVQLTVKIEGVGNVKLLPAPIVDIPNITSSTSGEAITVDSTDLIVRGSKTFRFLLTPRKDGELPLGTLRYAFFNPVRGAYTEATALLGALRVAPGTTVVDDAGQARAPALPLQAWSAATATDVTELWWFRAACLALGIPWLALIARRLLRYLPTAEPRERRRARRDVPMEADDDAASVRRTFIRGLAPIVALRSDEPFAVSDVVRRLRRAGATADAADAAGALLTRLDALTFGTPTASPSTSLVALERESAAVLKQLAAELSSKVRQRLSAAARTILLIAGTSLALNAQPAAFATGVAAYQRQHFTDAAAAFATAASAEPHSAAAWANLGAAHLMRADTAGAILAWQRSARLAPRGNPALEQLRVFAPNSDLRTSILPLTPDTAWLLLLGVTVALSIGGAAWRWSNRRISNASLLGAVLLVGSCALLSVAAQRSANADGLVLVRRDVALRTEPVLAGEAGARARGGEVVVVQEVRGTWRLLSAPGGRTGWVEADAVSSLALGDGHDVALSELRIATDSPAP